MLILDEPTNHLDVDAREALIQALNEYSGAVVIVSHDRHMLEMTADRLVLVDRGTAREFDGSIDDYIAFVLAKEPDAGRLDEGGVARAKGMNRKDQRKSAAEAREKSQELRKRAGAIEAELEKLTKLRTALDHAMFDPATADKALAAMTMTELMKRRAEVQLRIEAAEAQWLEASEALEATAA
jgi:ATP-binding cassette subfamily F protein 3